MEYVVSRFDGSETRFSLSYCHLREEHGRFVAMSDEEFRASLPDAAHLACIIGVLKELGEAATMGDAGIVHELIHLMTIPEHIARLPEIREQFRIVLMLS